MKTTRMKHSCYKNGIGVEERTKKMFYMHDVRLITTRSSVWDNNVVSMMIKCRMTGLFRFELGIVYRVMIEFDDFLTLIGVLKFTGIGANRDIHHFYNDNMNDCVISLKGGSPHGWRVRDGRPN